MKIMIELFRLLVSSSFWLIDIFLLPYYIVIGKPWIVWRNAFMKRSIAICKNGEREYWIKNWPDTKTTFDYSNVSTITQYFDNAISRYPDREIFGHREMLQEELATVNGKLIKKFKFQNFYTWITYQELGRMVSRTAAGLQSLGVTRGHKVVIILETRPEWLTAALAIFKLRAVVCTLYETLASDGIFHGINEAGAKVIVCNLRTAKIICEMNQKIPQVQYLILVGDYDLKISSQSKLKIITFNDFMIGQETQFENPIAEDLALIMYTSGTTGTPKGVMFNQGQFVHMFNSWNSLFDHWNLGSKPRYLAYLPIAHIFEFLIEIICIGRGIPIGFSSPTTVFDFSPGLINCCAGDVSVLKPTFMIAVPLILERLKSKIESTITSQSSIQSVILTESINHNIRWQKFGFIPSLPSSYFMKNFRSILGSNIRTILTGSAPVSGELLLYIKSAFKTDVLVVYAATESMAVGCSMDRWGSIIFGGAAGGAMAGAKLSLLPWKEGKYFPSDRPKPRGELLIGGPSVSLGYYCRQEETEQNFLIGKNGTRWFKTGDIGVIDTKYGVIQIIDRKKDFVKLSNGQFVSLTKIELCLKKNVVVENICVVADSRYNFLVAIIVPDKYNLMRLASNLQDDEGLTCNDQVDFGQDFCSDKTINTKLYELIKCTGVANGLKRIEIPALIHITNQEWTPSNGLVTASLKLRRKQVIDHYKHVIDKMFIGQL